MLRRSVSLLVALTACSQVHAVEFKPVLDWLKKPADRPMLGNMHGDIAVAANGEIYFSVIDPKAGIMVFSPEGNFLRVVPNAPSDFHGFVIHKESEGEFIYGPQLSAGNIVKLKLDGTEVLRIPSSAIPDEFKGKDKDGKPVVRFTGMDVAPNGDIYVTDGYGTDYIHRFDRTGKHIASYGGKKEPFNFKTVHKLRIDTRFSPPRIVATDRANSRIVHLSLEGELLGVVATGLRAPSALDLQGDLLVIGELKGRVIILDKEGKTVATMGENTVADEIGTNKTEPDRWRPGQINAAHGVAFDAKGNVYVSEWNVYGRVHRFDRQ